MNLKNCCQIAQQIQRPNSEQRRTAEAGFTIIETLVVVVIVGILAAIAAPGWHAFQVSRRLNTAQDEVFQAIRQTQAEALRSHINWQVSFRDTGNTVQWAMHPTSVQSTAASWQNLLAGVQIDTATTTLTQEGVIYWLQFDDRGQINGQLGKLTLRTNDADRLKRCVIASTLLGNLRRDANEGCQ